MDTTRLAPDQQLTVQLRDLLISDESGMCDPVSVDSQSAPGLLLNPTQALADQALSSALTRAHEREAVLLVHFLGHGSGHQSDPATSARHLLHVWDTVADPADAEPESRGWDPYALVNRRRAHCPGWSD